MNYRSISVLSLVALFSISPSWAQQQPPKPAMHLELKGGPVEQAKAAAILRDSPRHGEWVDVPLAGAAKEGAGGGAGGKGGAQSKLKTWIVYPERADKAPVVIVIHEIFGMSEWVRATADQLAADGFIAIAPDLLSGKGPEGGATDSMSPGQVSEAIRKLTPDEVTSRLSTVRDYALKLPSAAQKCGCIGFCWGGSQSFSYAAAQPKLAAAVVCYGTAPMKDNKPDTEALSKIQCPVLGLYGGNDARVTATVEPTDQAMHKLNKLYEHHEYEGAGHGFVRQQTGAANIEAAKRGWGRAVAFLKEYLE